MTQTRTIAETLLFQLQFYNAPVSEVPRFTQDVALVESAIKQAEQRGYARAKRTMQYNKSKEKADV